MHINSAHLRVTFTDGVSLETRISAARGSLDNPLTDRELEAKLHALCAYGHSGVAADRLIQAVWQLEHSADAGSLMRLAQCGSPGIKTQWAH
jgi:2-methylcitrate dehydratase PrpD